MEALTICECRPSKVIFYALSELNFIKFCAELGAKLQKKNTFKIFNNFVKWGKTYEKVPVLHSKVKILRRFRILGGKVIERNGLRFENFY